MSFTDGALQAATDGLTAAYPYVGLHSADPGTTGANETTATRILVGWPAASGTGDTTVSNVAFSGGASNGPVLYWGLWSSATAGTFGGSFPFDAGSDAAFNAAGQYTATSLTINAANP